MSAGCGSAPSQAGPDPLEPSSSAAISTGASAVDAPRPAARLMPVARTPLPLDAGAYYLPTQDPKLPRVRYVDGQVSGNDSCMIRLGSKLNRRMPPAYVNGFPLGFC
jgi:hypothetical protein